MPVSDPYRLYQVAESHRECGDEESWKEIVMDAFQLPHRTKQQLFYRGQAKIALGDWSGWVDREARLFNPDEQLWRCSYWRQVRAKTKAWDGKEDIRDKALFVIADGDDGDCLQMLRFIPDLTAKVDTLILGVSPALLSLVKHFFASKVTVTFREVDHGLPFQRYTWIMSLPALCGALPPIVPFTAPRPQSPPRLADGRFHVGLWTAPESVPPATLAGITSALARDDIQWHDLRLGTGAIRTYADAANVIVGLDYVVSIDSPIAHLAGLLAVPTLVFLSCRADLRWGLTETTPWYPSMHITRHFGDSV